MSFQQRHYHLWPILVFQIWPPHHKMAHHKTFLILVALQQKIIQADSFFQTSHISDQSACLVNPTRFQQIREVIIPMSHQRVPVEEQCAVRKHCDKGRDRDLEKHGERVYRTRFDTT